VARVFETFRVGDTDAFDDLIVDDYVQHDAQAANACRQSRITLPRSGRSTSRCIG
jgi:hypothetical protein